MRSCCTATCPDGIATRLLLRLSSLPCCSMPLSSTKGLSIMGLEKRKYASRSGLAVIKAISASFLCSVSIICGYPPLRKTTSKYRPVLRVITSSKSANPPEKTPFESK
ncbi:hypothetical protein D3C80_1082790 [compost metagenome]